MKLLFQDEINNFVENLTIETCPRSIALVGKRGSGRKTTASNIAEKLNIQKKDITKKLNFDDIIEIYVNSVPMLYIIDGDSLSEKDQYSLLKFLEEPPKLCIACVICEDGKLLETIMNRCYQIHFVPYTNEQLSHFYNGSNPYILELFETPGEILNYKDIDLEPYQSLVNNMVKNLNRANISNVLTIPNKFNFDKKLTNNDRLDFLPFVGILRNTIYKNCLKNSDVYPLYSEILSMCKKLEMNNLSKKNIFENFLIDAKMKNLLWE
jgi:ABC-type dipeptide/oligopeptide/nickel transport system ATPase component